MGSDDGRERRRFPRRPMLLRVEYPDRRAYVASWTENVSQGGLFVRTDEPFVIGERVSLVLSFPGLLAPTHVEGIVAWIREPEAGWGRGIGVRVDDDRSRRRLVELALSSPREAAEPPRYDVLVVEDNPHVAKSYERVLKRITELSACRIGIQIADNGHTALGLLQAAAVDLIITDLYMPVLDGIALIREIKKDERLRQIPVLVVSAGLDQEADALRSAGIEAVLPKPVQFATLLETITCLLWLRAAEPR